MQENKRRLSGKALAWLLTLVYFASYMTRKNFATVLQEVITETQFAKDLLSVVLVSMTVAYGVGQIISGRLGDKIKPTNLILIGLSLATVVNIVFPFASSSVAVMAVLWGINGFAQSMMWPPIVKILVSTCDDAMYSYSVVRISWGSSFATIALYLIAPLVISLTGTFKGMFLISVVIGIAVLILWLSLKGRISCSDPAVPSSSGSKSNNFRIPRAAMLPLVFIILGIIFQGMLRDGVATWMPTYMTEVHSLSNESSILSAVFPAIFSIVCFWIAGVVHKRFFKNEVVCAALLFAVSLLSALALVLFFGKSMILSVVCFTVITGCMHGINLMLITHVPKRFKKYGNISTFAGLVNACTYIGEAIFTYGFAFIAGLFDWRISIAVCLGIAAFGLLSCIIAARPWRKFSEQ